MNNQEKIKIIDEIIDEAKRDRKMYADGVKRAEIEVCFLNGEKEPVKKLRKEKESDLNFYKYKVRKVEIIIETLELMKKQLVERLEEGTK